MILVSKSWIHIANNMAQNWRQSAETGREVKEPDEKSNKNYFDFVCWWKQSKGGKENGKLLAQSTFPEMGKKSKHFCVCFHRNSETVSTLTNHFWLQLNLLSFCFAKLLTFAVCWESLNKILPRREEKFSLFWRTKNQPNYGWENNFFCILNKKKTKMWKSTLWVM